MADDDQDQEQKTEQPSQKRLEDAFKKGNVPFSREITSFLLLTLLAFVVGGAAPSILQGSMKLLLPFVTDFDQMPSDRSGLGLILRKTIIGAFGVIAIPLVASMVVIIFASVSQNGLVLSNEPLMPKLERISPLSGIKRLFSMRSLVEFGKGIFKIIIVGWVAFSAVYPELKHISQLPDSDMVAILLYFSKLATHMTIGVAVAMFFIALFDLLWQRFQFTKSLRMTKQEVKEEYKQSEGDPVIKGKLRRLRQERARQRMMSAVPEADVVITNPTHFAVALKYESAKMKAPTVVAKGQDLIALRIRELAKDNDVPIVENPPLARALFDAADIDEEIPIQHYEAVAKIISFVYKLKGKRYS